MKKLFTIVCTLALGGALAFAQTGGDKKPAEKAPAAAQKTDVKAKKGAKKGHKGGKKSKKGSASSTSTSTPK